MNGDKSMKKLFFVLVSILFLNSSYAQSGTYLGLRVGGGYNSLYNPRWVNPEGADNMIKKYDVLGTFYGVELLHNFKDVNVGIKSGFIQRTYKYNMSVNYVTPGEFFSEYTINVNEIPLIFQFRSEKMNTRRSISAFTIGHYYEIGLQYQITSAMEASSYIGTNVEDKTVTDLMPYYKKGTIAPVIGIGMGHFAFGRIQILHGLRLTYTIGDFQEDKDFEFFQPGRNFKGWEKDYMATNLFSFTYILSVNIGIYGKDKI